MKEATPSGDITLEKSCLLQIMEISDFQQIAIILSTNLQRISIPWKCPKGWKLTSNKFPYHGSVQNVGSIMKICWKS